LSYKNAETRLHASNLNIRLLATRYDLPLQPSTIIDQTPQPGEEVIYGYPVGITITKADSYRRDPYDGALAPVSGNPDSEPIGIAEKNKLCPRGYESPSRQIT
jgi:hypothetical protein